MMLRLVTIALLFAIGSNAEHLRRGIRSVNPEDLNDEELRKLMTDESEGSKATGSEEDPSASLLAALQAPDTGVRDDADTAPPLHLSSRALTNHPTGTCLCDTLCNACNSFGTGMPSCQIVCSFVGIPNCNELCDNFIQTGDTGGEGGALRDDPVPEPTLPPGPPTCQCVAICQGCQERGSNSAPCRSICEYAAEEDPYVCNTKCNDILNIDEFAP